MGLGKECRRSFCNQECGHCHLKLPPVKLHRSMLGKDVIKAAVKDWKDTQGSKTAQQERPNFVSRCFMSRFSAEVHVRSLITATTIFI
jgi:hypothetical protein